MSLRSRLGLVGTTAVLLVVVTASPSHALTMSAPASKNLGMAATGAGTLTAQLGTVTVTASGIVAPSFVATVTCTVFLTGGASANETIAKASIYYWSGTGSTSGLLSGGTPGQATALQAQDLSVSRTAFTGVGLLLSVSASWNPTIVVHIPSSAVAGTYSGTITHSVA